MRVLVGFWVVEGLTDGFWAVLRELFFGGSDISAQSGGGQFEARDSRICRKRPVLRAVGTIKSTFRYRYQSSVSTLTITMTNEHSAIGYAGGGHKLKSSTYKIAISIASFGVFLEFHIALPFAPDSFSFITMDLFPDSARDLHRRMRRQRWRRNRYNVEWQY